MNPQRPTSSTLIRLLALMDKHPADTKKLRLMEFREALVKWNNRTQRTCVICSKPFHGTRNSQTCTKECAAKHAVQKYQGKLAENRRLTVLANKQVREPYKKTLIHVRDAVDMVSDCARRIKEEDNEW